MSLSFTNVLSTYLLWWRTQKFKVNVFEWWEKLRVGIEWVYVSGVGGLSILIKIWFPTVQWNKCIELNVLVDEVKKGKENKVWLDWLQPMSRFGEMERTRKSLRNIFWWKPSLVWWYEVCYFQFSRFACFLAHGLAFDENAFPWKVGVH